MAPVRRAAPTAKPTGGTGFGALGFYFGGSILPEGDYAMEFNVIMHQGTKQDGSPAGPARLGVMITAHPLSGGDPSDQFLSMGTKASESFAPDPETGKSLVAVAGGPGLNPNNKTNWFYFLKSLYDCGLPEGIFENDLTTIDGIHVHTQNIPEPEDRKSFGARTGEAGAEERRGGGLMPVVSEIKEDGKPWEGTGGLPSAKPAGKKAAPVAARAPVRAAAKAAPVAAVENEDVEASALNAVAAVLEKSPNGCTKVALRTGTFKSLNDTAGDEMAQAVLDTYFGSDDTLNALVNQLEYSVQGVMVKPMAK